MLWLHKLLNCLFPYVPGLYLLFHILLYLQQLERTCTPSHDPTHQPHRHLIISNHCWQLYLHMSEWQLQKQRSNPEVATWGSPQCGGSIPEEEWSRKKYQGLDFYFYILLSASQLDTVKPWIPISSFSHIEDQTYPTVPQAKQNVESQLVLSGIDCLPTQNDTLILLYNIHHRVFGNYNLVAPIN